MVAEKEVNQFKDSVKQSFAERELERKANSKGIGSRGGDFDSGLVGFGLSKVELIKLSRTSKTILCEGGSEGDLG